jgi:hypothetical protein
MARVSRAVEDVLAEVSRLPLHTVVELESADGRAVFILGESHVKTREAADLCRQAVQAFSLRGVERLQREDVFAGELLGGTFEKARGVLESLSGGRLAGSTIEAALGMPDGDTVELERTEHVPRSLDVGTGYLAVYTTFVLPALLTMPLWGSIPSLRTLRVAARIFGLHLYALPLAYVLRDRPWAWAIQPLLTILTVRDELLADGVRRMLATHPQGPAIVIVGRAHVPGIVERLVEHGFRRAGERAQGIRADWQPPDGHRTGRAPAPRRRSPR